jgi:Flp pilus assembly protein TadG
MQVNVDNAQSDPNQFTVTIRYDAENLPIWNLMTGLPLPDTTIMRSIDNKAWRNLRQGGGIRYARFGIAFPARAGR